MALLLPLACAAAPAAPALVLLVDTSAQMPQAHVENDHVIEGLHLELGRALARRLGREIVAKPVPRKRLAEALQRGEGDLMCDYQSDWVPGSFAWSRPFIPDQALVVSAATAPPPAGLAVLAGVPVGTVRGYVYPEMSEALREGFRRDDAPDAATNLQKLQRGRIDHALTGRRALEYQQRIGALRLALHPPLLVSEVLAQCALSPTASLSLPDLNAAIHGLVTDGELNRLLARYR